MIRLTEGGNGMDIILADAAGGAERVFKRVMTTWCPAAFSPDGKWIAYYDVVAGRPDLMVAPLDGSAAPKQVGSAARSGGVFWFDDGTIVYGEPAGNHLMGVSTKFTGSDIELGQPKVMFRDTPFRGATSTFDVFRLSFSQDGKRVLAALPVRSGRDRSISIIQNWPAVLAPQPQP